MREFFQGWRRKVGCLTLVVACVFTIAWIRSLSVEDRVIFCADKDWLHEFTMSGHAMWWVSSEVTEGPRDFRDIHSKTISWTAKPMAETKWYAPYEGFEPTSFYDLVINRRWHGFGFDFGEFRWRSPSSSELTTSFRCKVRCIPYWSITIPLILISLGLLLSKHLPLTQQKTAEPIANEGT